jgi:hypothetical protein
MSVLLMACVQVTTEGAIVTFQAGNQDGFAAPSDPVSPSTALVDAYAARHGQSVIDFDVFTPNRGVAHTFTDLPAGIVDATLEFRLKGMGASFPENDVMYLGFVDSSTPAWDDARARAQTLANLKAGLGLGTGWGYREDRTFVLSLAALPMGSAPPKNIISQLNERRFLDVIIFDDTAVDYMKLTLETNVIPEPSTFIIFSGLLLSVLVGGGLRGLTGSRSKDGKVE